MNWGQRQELVENLVTERLPNQPVTYALHQGGDTNPHAHILVSERLSGEHTREQFFKRTGSKKNRDMNKKFWLIETREAWSELVNSGLEHAGSGQRVSHLSLAKEADLSAERAQKAALANQDKVFAEHLHRIAQLDRQPKTKQYWSNQRLKKETQDIGSQDKKTRAGQWLDVFKDEIVKKSKGWGQKIYSAGRLFFGLTSDDQQQDITRQSQPLSKVIDASEKKSEGSPLASRFAKALQERKKQEKIKQLSLKIRDETRQQRGKRTQQNKSAKPRTERGIEL